MLRTAISAAGMRGRTRSTRAVALALGTLAALSGLSSVAAAHGRRHSSQAPVTIYSSIPSPLPANLPSEGPEAYAFDEFGDQIEFAGVARQLTTVEVTLSDWACETGHWYNPGECVSAPGSGFQVPITLNVYEVGTENSVGPLIATDTQTFFVPYRPSDSPLSQCPKGNEETWFDPRSETCNHGIASNVTFDLSSQEVTLPNKVIYGISYDSTHYGPKPIGESAACYASSAGCPYDSLNIALSEEATIGVHPLEGTIYQQSPYGHEYCDGGAAGVGVFRLDSPSEPCWAGEWEGAPYSYLPAVAFHAANPPQQRQDCLKDGWQSLTDEAGVPFADEGECVSWVSDGGREQHGG